MLSINYNLMCEKENVMSLGCTLLNLIARNGRKRFLTELLLYLFLLLTFSQTQYEDAKF